MKLRTFRQTVRSGFANSLCLAIALAGLLQVAGFVLEARAQTSSAPAEAPKQLPAPVPVLKLKGAVGHIIGRTHYHKLTFAIVNWDRYSAAMFTLPIGRKLPLKPCTTVKSRVVLALYGATGTVLSNCVPMPGPGDLGEFSILIQKGKQVPEFVYAVLNDRHTGAAYRSNLVSPWNGLTK